MPSDMVVALPQATGRNGTLFGLNVHGSAPQLRSMRRIAGRVHAPGEMLRLGQVELPEVRQTCTILGNQLLGAWGLTHGINEHGVAVGSCRWHSKLPGSPTGLSGPELVRLTLERSHSARQGLDVLADLIVRHGQRPENGDGGNNIFLLADGREAFVIEAAGAYWASLECQQVRAVCDVGLIRQDWRRLAPGLAEFVIAQGWWPDDGSKVDVAASLGDNSACDAAALKRWGKATMLLEQQNGHIDHHFLRQMLAEHFDTAVRMLRGPERLLGSVIAVLGSDPEDLPILWCSFGSLYVPVFPLADQTGEPQQELTLPRFEEWLNPEERSIRTALERLQQRIDQETEDFVNEARMLARNDRAQAYRLAATLMDAHRELLQAEARRLPTRQTMALAEG